VGCSRTEEMKVLATAGREAVPLEAGEAARIEAVFAPYARRLAFYRGVV